VSFITLTGGVGQILVRFITSVPEPSWHSEIARAITIMNTVVLLQKLDEIERALDVEERATIRKMVLDAQQCALQLQRCVETPGAPATTKRQSAKM
jgi:hypothetical protein